MTFLRLVSLWYLEEKGATTKQQNLKMGNARVTWCCLMLVRKCSLICVVHVNPMHSPALAACKPPGLSMQSNMPAGRKLCRSFLWDAFACYAWAVQSNWVDNCSKTVFVLTKSCFILFCFVFIKVADMHARVWVGCEWEVWDCWR